MPIDITTGTTYQKTALLMSIKKAFSTVFNSRNSSLALLAIVGLAIFLRLYALDFKSMWIDELYTVVPTNPSNSIDFIINYSKSDQPPLYFLLMHFWFKVFTYNSFYARLLPAIIGIAGVVGMFFLGKEIKNKQVGYYAAFLCCINYFQIYYSQESRFYSLLFLLTVLSFIFFLRSLRLKKYVDYFFYFISTVGLLYTQYFGMIVVFIQGIIFVIYVILYKPSTKFVITGIVLAALTISAFLPWLPILLYDNDITSYWIEKPKIYFPLVYYYLYWGKDIFLCVSLGVVALLYLKNVYDSWRSSQLQLFERFVFIVLASWIVLSYSVPFVRSMLSTPILIPRYTIVTLPPLLIIMALGLDLIKRQTLVMGLSAALLASAVINLFLVRNHYHRLDKAQWREAASVVIAKSNMNTKIYSNLEWWYNFYFYKTEPRIRVTGIYTADNEPGLENFIQEIGDSKEFWVLSGESTTNGVTTSQQEYIDAHYDKKETHIFYAASAILYAKK